MRGWRAALGVVTLFIEPASPWENGFIESFNCTLRDELLNGEIFYTALSGTAVFLACELTEHRRRAHS